MAYQEILSKKPGDYTIPIVGEVLGKDLVNASVSSKLGHYPKFRVFPLLSIKEDKGTGVVTSVPAEAPDDYVAWKDLKNNAAFRDRFGIRLEDVEAFQPVCSVCLCLSIISLSSLKV
jgi:leucyl-tRNA synthetase